MGCADERQADRSALSTQPLTEKRRCTLIALGIDLGGCVVGTQAPLQPHPDYQAMKCDQLLSASKRLVVKQSDRSEYLLENGEAEKRTAAALLRAVKQSIAEKNC